MAGALTRVAFVDAGSTAAGPDGSLDKPFHSIQAAVDAVPKPADDVASTEDWMILIAPGDYDEDVTITGFVRLALIGLGGFRLGRYTTAGGGQANIVASNPTPKNLKWIYHASDLVANAAAPQLVIGTLGGTDVFRRGKAISNRISGSIVVEGNGWTPANAPQGGTAFLAITTTEVDAGIRTGQNTATQPAIDARLFSGILVDRHYYSRFRGEILGQLNITAGVPPAYVWAATFMSQYEGLVQVARYHSVEQCGLERGMTVSLVPQLDNLKSVVPPGIMNSTFAGTFTGPSKSLLLDSVTNTWFARNGAALAGAATKSFLDAPPVIRTGADLVLGHRENGATILVRPVQALTITLPGASGEDGMTFTIKHVGTPAPLPPAHPVTVTPQSGERIDNKNALTLGPLSALHVVAYQGNWWIMSRT